jgi:SpoVK/Ycf46/Vps4 family AAA+-type ATPase
MLARTPLSDPTRFQSTAYHAIVRELRNPTSPQPTLVSFSGAPLAGLRQSAIGFAAALGRSPFRVDLSQVVSRYIGETEKNLRSLFGRADPNSWVLFFDEGDALFGRRSTVSDAHDRYADQGVNYLLPQLAQYRGIIVALLEHPEPAGHRPLPLRHVRITFPPA